MTAASESGLAIGGDTAATPGVAASVVWRRGERCHRLGVTAVGDEDEGAVEAGTEAVGHQVVGAAGGEAGRVVAGVREPEAQPGDGGDQHSEDERSGEPGDDGATLDGPAPPVPEAASGVIGGRVAERQPQPVDVAPGEPEQRREQRERGQHHGEHGDDGGEGDAGDVRLVHRQHAEQGDDDGDPGEHDRPSSGGHRDRRPPRVGVAPEASSLR